MSATILVMDEDEGMRAAIPVVLLTSRSDAQPRAKELGAAACLAKPLRVDQLLTTVAKHLEGRVVR